MLWVIFGAIWESRKVGPRADRWGRWHSRDEALATQVRLLEEVVGPLRVAEEQAASDLDGR